MPQMLQFTTYGTLAPGLHSLSLQEVQQFFGMANSRRRNLFMKLRDGLKNLKQANVKDVYLDGSFVTQKSLPNDIDGCWDVHEQVLVAVLDPVFLDFSNGRKAMKDKYGVEFFIANTVEGASGVPFVAFFQTDRDGNAKGIVHLDLSQEANL